MGIQIIKDGQVIKDDNKPQKTEVELLQQTIDRQDKYIDDLQNQIKDLKADLRFYKIHGK